VDWLVAMRLLIRAAAGFDFRHAHNNGATVMELRTLVLNSWMQPHGIISWQQAVVLQIDAKVDVVETYEATVSSAGNSYEGRAPLVIQVPAVIRLRQHVRMHKDGIKFSRSNVLTRDRLTCSYCGKKLPPQKLNYDHVVPRVQGGKTAWNNIATACVRCNSKKGGRTPHQAGMKLLQVPYEPKSLSTRAVIFDISRAPSQWLPYLQHNAASA
jgi:5-methylcytosine-specific restriction endonuclease McrA